MSRPLVASAVLAAALSVSATAWADVIISPNSVAASSSDPEAPAINTINQSGLLSPFVSGVTDFDAYMAGSPLHDLAFETEWFSQEELVANNTSAVLTFDLGSVVTINRLALWNEEFAGIAGFNLLVSTDGLTYATVLSGVSPTDNPIDQNYAADIFALGTQSARFVRLDAFNCPQPNPDGYVACGLGEIAFAMLTDGGEPPTGTPAPGAIILLGGGLFGLLGLRISRKTR